MKNFLLFIGLSIVMFGCASAPVQYADRSYKDQQDLVTLGIDRGDFEKAAVDMTENMLQSGALNKRGGGRYVVAIDRIINDTMQRIDTDMLIKKIRITMLKSGKAVVTTAIKVGGAESTLTHSVRELRNNDEVKRTTVAKKNSIIAPDLGLSGKIIQRNSRSTKGKQIVDYYFQLSLTDLESGLALWEDEVVVGKIGSKKSVSW